MFVLLTGCATIAPKVGVSDDLEVLIANCPSLVCFKAWEFGARESKFGEPEMSRFVPEPIE